VPSIHIKKRKKNISLAKKVPVRRTGAYRHKKALPLVIITSFNVTVSIFTHRTLPCRGTKFDVFSLSGYRYLRDSGTDWHEILHDGTVHISPGQISCFEGSAPADPQIRNFGHLLPTPESGTTAAP